MHTKYLCDCFCVSQMQKAQLTAGRGPKLWGKTTHTSKTHTGQKESWLYVTEEQIHKHLYKDINYCISMSLNTCARTRTHIHPPTPRQNLKLNKEDARQGGNQHNNLDGERAWLERQSAGVLIELWLESVSCLYAHPWSMIQTMIFLSREKEKEAAKSVPPRADRGGDEGGGSPFA